VNQGGDLKSRFELVFQNWTSTEKVVQAREASSLLFKFLFAWERIHRDFVRGFTSRRSENGFEVENVPSEAAAVNQLLRRRRKLSERLRCELKETGRLSLWDDLLHACLKDFDDHFLQVTSQERDELKENLVMNRRKELQQKAYTRGSHV
jgi:hypothetical protein